MDADGDNYAVAPTVESCTSPGTGYTQNVLPLTDCDDDDPNVFEVSTWYLDADGDGYTTSNSIENCTSPGANYTNLESSVIDCDDTDASVFLVSTWYLDADDDGHSTGESIESCESPGPNYVKNTISNNDCNDNDAVVFESSNWYFDSDGDGFTAAESISNCGNPGIGYYATPSISIDCDDNNQEINPETIWLLDADNDGTADNDEFIISCLKPGIGYTNIAITPYSISDKIIVYPNPTTETVEIDLGEIFSNINLSLVNSSKQLVLSKDFQNQRLITFNISTLASGIYFIEIAEQNQVIGSHKIIKL